MDESSNEVLLDEMSTPDGDIELVAYQSRGAVWVGIRPKGWSHVDRSPTRSAIGLHTGSEEHYVEASAEIHRTWGVTFGAVAPEVARVAVRNEHRELFPGMVIPLPASFNEEFRAAWGLATNCERIVSWSVMTVATGSSPRTRPGRVRDAAAPLRSLWS